MSTGDGETPTIVIPGAHDYDPETDSHFVQTDLSKIDDILKEDSQFLRWSQHGVEGGKSRIDRFATPVEDDSNCFVEAAIAADKASGDPLKTAKRCKKLKRILRQFQAECWQAASEGEEIDIWIKRLPANAESPSKDPQYASGGGEVTDEFEFVDVVEDVLIGAISNAEAESGK